MASDYTGRTDSSKFTIEVLSIPVSKFRANLAELLDELGEEYQEITLTKNGKIVAHILPPKYLVPSFEGSLKGIVQIPEGVDLENLSASDEDWEEQLLASWERVEVHRNHAAESGER